MQPNDYTIDLSPATGGFVQGLQGGLGLRQLVDAREQAEAQRQAQAQMRADLSAGMQNPQLLPGLMVKYPQLAEKLKHGWDAMNANEQQAQLSHATEVASALYSGRPEVAVQVLKGRAEALRNSGDEQGAKKVEAMAQWAEQDPLSLQQATLARISALSGGDKVIEGIVKLGGERRAADKAPADLATAEAGAREAGAKATTAEAKAKHADSEALLDLQKKGWDIRKVQEDIEIAKQNARISAMNATIAREGNDLKRQELQLKVQDAITARDDKIRGKVAEAENGAASIDNMLNTIERVKKAPGLDNVLGSIEGRLPSVFSDENTDAEALVETLMSQAFVAQIPSIKGTGALSDAEGKKLQSALQSLDRKQSEDQFRKNLDEAARLLNKARSTLSTRTGVPLGKPDTPAAPGARPPLESFLGR